MQFCKQEIRPIILGPMAGVTDLAFRNTCAALGANITVTEMVSSRALVYQDQKSRTLLKKTDTGLCGAQIFGNDPAIMAEAAEMAIAISGCDFLDINMGCPMPKVANSGDGCGLMRTPELAGKIVETVAQRVDVPVTVKCRLGWDKGSINVVDFARRMEASGAAAIAVHARTRAMLYSGNADWDYITRVKQAVRLPVIANGDILSGESALRCLRRTGADGVMIARGSLGDPWIFAEITAAMDGAPIPARPPLRERVEVAVAQFRMACADHGEHIACLQARKHFAWYLRGVPYAGYYKAKISEISSMEDILCIAKGIQHDLGKY